MVTSFLNAWRNPEHEVRIAVQEWIITELVTDQYIERSKSPRMVWEYLKRIGPVAVWRKLRSRLAEGSRNQKIVGVGAGQILEAPRDGHVEPGQKVIFFAPNHSLNWPRIVLDQRLLIPFNFSEEKNAKNLQTLPSDLRKYAGWSCYAGWPLDDAAIKKVLYEISKDYAAENMDIAHSSTFFQENNICERREGVCKSSQRPSAVVFGLGNYAKTQIIPHIRKHLHLEGVHEIDPDQLETFAGSRATLDTNPWPRVDESYDAWFIAGFHHTHAPLAVQAIESGAYAVVEKPLATTNSQYEATENALDKATQNRLFTCFHKRYSRINEWVWEDFGFFQSGAPLDMHCIVYEIPLPRLHWYNWPNSGSRLISNGCHWLDYFLYVNGFAAVADADVLPLRGSDLSVWVQLDNGAQLVMSLTDSGSQRLGVRDTIELRTGNKTARIIDGTYYQAESSDRMLRRRKVNPLESYARMYRTICKCILGGKDGDPFDALRSTKLTLALEKELKRKRGLF